MAYEALASALLPSIIGGQQIGGMAPAFGGGGGLLSAEALKRISPDMSSMLSLPSALTQDSDPVGSTAEASAEPITTAPLGGAGAVNAGGGMPSLMPQSEPPPEQGLFSKFGGALGQFSEGLDKGLQSPSQLLGLGLLGRVHPDAPLAGLAAMGLLNSDLLKRR